MKNDKTLKQIIQRLSELRIATRESRIEMGNLVVKALQINPDAFDAIIASDPKFNLSALESLHRLGLGIKMEIAFPETPGAVRLAALPFTEILAIQDTPVNVLKWLSNGEEFIEAKLPQDLSGHEAVRVIDLVKGIRSTDEQREFEDERERERLRFKVVDDGVQTLGSQLLTWATLADLVEKHKQQSLSTLGTDMKKKQAA